MSSYYVPSFSLTSFIFLIIGGVGVVLRGVSRILVRRIYGWEDALFVVGLALTIAVLGLDSSLDLIGSEVDFPGPEVETSWQQLLALELTSLLGPAFFKASLLAHYGRLFAPAPSPRIVYLVAACVGIQTLAGVVLLATECAPLATREDGLVSSLCYDNFGLGFGVFIPDFVTAAVVLGLPLFYLRRVQWSPRYVFCLVGMLAAGVLTLFNTALRLLAQVGADEFSYPALSASAGLLMTTYLLVTNLTQLHPLFSRDARRRARHTTHAPGLSVARTGAGAGAIPLESREVLLVDAERGEAWTEARTEGFEGKDQAMGEEEGKPADVKGHAVEVQKLPPYSPYRPT